MKSPPSRFWPGELTPLQGLYAYRSADRRSSSYHLARRTSPSDTALNHSLKASIFHYLTVATLLFRYARHDRTDPVLTHSSATCKVEYRYEHSPPSASILCC